VRVCPKGRVRSSGGSGIGGGVRTGAPARSCYEPSLGLDAVERRWTPSGTRNSRSRSTSNRMPQVFSDPEMRPRVGLFAGEMDSESGLVRDPVGKSVGKRQLRGGGDTSRPSGECRGPTWRPVLDPWPRCRRSGAESASLWPRPGGAAPMGSACRGQPTYSRQHLAGES
jgi:hypothetical protein